MHQNKAFRGTAAGTIATAVPAIAGVQPSVSLLIGALALTIVVYQEEPVRPYAMAGTAWALALSVLFAYMPIFPQVYTQTALFSLVSLGVISLLALIFRAFLKWGIKVTMVKAAGRTKPDESVRRTISAIFGTFTVAYGFLRVKERIIRSGVIGIFGPVSFILEFIGMKAKIPFFLVDGVNLTLFTLVGCLVIGFHTLSSWHAAFLMKDHEKAQVAGKKAKQGTSKAKTTLAGTVSRARKNINSDATN